MTQNSYRIYDQLPEQMNLAAHLLDNIPKEFLARTAYYCENKSITYKELILMVQKFSGLLKEINIQQEERVVILLPDCIEFVFGFLGVIWSGAVAVMINEAYALEDIQYILKDSRATKILTTQAWKNKLSHNQKTFQWLLIDDPMFEAKLSNAVDIKTAAKVAREEAAFWVYTSGSTGRPKGVIHAHYSPIVAAENYGRHILKLNHNDKIYSAAPMAFSYGLGASIYFPLYFKVAVILCKTKSPFAHIKTINQFQPTVFFAVPHTYASIHALKEVAPLNTVSLRLCISAAEVLPVTLWKRWKKNYGISLCEGIGTTESTHIFISNREDDIVPGSSGKVVPGYSIRLINDHSVEVLPGEVGLLEISGEGFMRGYWNQLKQEQKILSGQRMLTGDLYRMDEAKNFYFVGRKDQLIKIKGMWILPAEIENVFLEHEWVEQAAVTIEKGLLEDTAEVVAYLKVRHKAEDALEILRQHLKRRLPKFKIPKKINFISEVPITATGKMNKQSLHIS